MRLEVGSWAARTDPRKLTGTSQLLCQPTETPTATGSMYIFTKHTQYVCTEYNVVVYNSSTRNDGSVRLDAGQTKGPERGYIDTEINIQKLLVRLLILSI